MKEKEGRMESDAIKGKALFTIDSDWSQHHFFLPHFYLLSYLHFRLPTHSCLFFYYFVCYLCHVPSQAKWGLVGNKRTYSCFHRIYLLGLETGRNEALRNDHMIIKTADEIWEGSMWSLRNQWHEEVCGFRNPYNKRTAGTLLYCTSQKLHFFFLTNWSLWQFCVRQVYQHHFLFQQHVQIFCSASHFGNSCLYSKTPPAKAQDDGYYIF